MRLRKSLSQRLDISRICQQALEVREACCMESVHVHLDGGEAIHRRALRFADRTEQSGTSRQGIAHAAYADVGRRKHALRTRHRIELLFQPDLERVFVEQLDERRKIRTW